MKNQISSLELQPCLSGEALAKRQPCLYYLSQIRSVVSAPPDTYAELYLATLYRFMELCQALPRTFPLDNQTTASKPFTLIHRALLFATATLQMRQGWLMPRHSDSEKIAAQDARWTYALLTAGLFRSIPEDWQSNYTIGLYKNEEERLGTWHPLTGNLYEPQTFYKIEKEPLSDPVHHSSLLTAWTGRLIPSVAIRWLADSSAVFIVWWEAMTQSPIHGDNPLGQHLQSVASELGIPWGIQSLAASRSESVSVNASTEVTSSHPIASPLVEAVTQVISSESTPSMPSPARQALIRLLQWLEARKKDSETGRFYLRVKNGLFIDETSLQLLIGQYTMYASVEIFLKALAEFLVTEKKSLIVYYRPIHFESREIRRGVVLAESFLSEEFKRLPVNGNFTPDLFTH